jgi:NDP-sugar pyrophosphorylase family protein
MTHWPPQTQSADPRPTPDLDPPLASRWIVLLAGGLGRRLSPLTDRCPKPLLHVGGRPLLEVILDRLAGQGFRRYYLCLHYKAETIQQQIGDGERFGVEIQHLVEERQLGTAGPLSRLPERPTSSFLVMNADLLTDLDFVELFRFHARQGAEATMCVREYTAQIPYGVVESSGERLLSVVERPVRTCHINAGIYLLEPSVLDLIPDDQPIDMPAIFQRLLEAGRPAAVYPVQSYWIDIGHLQDLQQANADFPLRFGGRPGGGVKPSP